MIVGDLTFKIVKGAAVPFRSTKEALLWARANGLIGRMGESETGGKGVVTISAESIRETLNPRQREKSDSDRVHFAALGKLRDLIRESRILEMHPDWPKGKDGRRDPSAADGRHEITICIAYAAFMFEDVAYRVRLTLKRYAQIGTSKAYAYRVNEIEVVPGTLDGKIAPTTNPTDTTSICADILLQGALDVNGVPLLRSYTDISVIILIGQEKIHLKRCVEKLAALKPRQIFLVESQPDDGGVAIAKETAAKLGLHLYTRYNKWPGLYAKQFNWALENLPIDAEWVMRLDADEYFLPEAIEELKEKLPKLPKDVTGIISKRRHYIFGGWAKHGTYPVKLLRVFRKGMAICEERYMDEHMQLKEGRAVEFDYDFVDHNLNSFEWWREKHRGYAKREAMDALEIMADIKSGVAKGIKIDGQAASKRALKYKYYRLPRYLRAVMYFCIRYFLKGGFLDGVAGWRWNFWQGLWYRWIVDREIGKMQKLKTEVM